MINMKLKMLMIRQKYVHGRGNGSARAPRECNQDL